MERRCSKTLDHGPMPYVVNIECMAKKNCTFRTAVWTGCHLQMTLMCIPPCGDIGMEMHEDTDQLIRVEQGRALVIMKSCNDASEIERVIGKNDVVFVPAGTRHNIVNIGEMNLKVSSTYAPPNHPRGTVHCTKADAEEEEY